MVIGWDGKLSLKVKYSSSFEVFAIIPKTTSTMYYSNFLIFTCSLPLVDYYPIVPIKLECFGKPVEYIAGGPIHSGLTKEPIFTLLSHSMYNNNVTIFTK